MFGLRIKGKSLAASRLSLVSLLQAGQNSCESMGVLTRTAQVTHLSCCCSILDLGHSWLWEDSKGGLVGWLVFFFFYLRHIFAGYLEDEENHERVEWVLCQIFNKPIIGAV